MIERAALLVLIASLLAGCIVGAAVDVATAPVRVAGKAVDLATTSQSEADRNRGRALRQREARLGKLERDYARDSRRCEGGDQEACFRARDQYAQIQDILPTVPAPPR